MSDHAPTPGGAPAPAPDRLSTAALDAALRAALGDQLPADAPVDEWALVNQGRLTEAELLRLYAEITGLPQVDEEAHASLPRLPDVTYDYLAHAGCLPLNWDDTTVVLAVASPRQLGRLALDWRAFLGRRAAFQLARRSWIERGLGALYEADPTRPDAIPGLEADASEEALRDLAREAPIVRVVSDILVRAVESGASDIHVEPSEEGLAVRYRIDGVLQTVQTLPKSHYAAISSRLKLLAGMNIAERRLPQDGRMDLPVGRTQMDVRVSTVPSLHGESIVLRLLPKDVSIFQLESLGLNEANRAEFEALIRHPHGMILVVGPTGSGKTTTLYCALRLLNSDAVKIISLEDPVEYQIPGVTQIQVRTQIGLTFANGLRSIVRQNPDIILVGEIRDRETAEIAIHAALTGHLVLSTLHTNDAPGAISRLLDMGVEGFLISSSLLGVLSQRLVRRLCTACGGSGHAPEASDSVRRCRACSGSGYRGRVGIFELMPVTDEIRRAINDRRDATEIAALARRHGMRTLREDGDLKVHAGLTTATEVARVCQLDFAD